MSEVIIPTETPTDRRIAELAKDSFLYLNGFVVQRIVFDLIKNYMVANTPEEAGVVLAQKYDLDPTKSDIHLDVAYNWKAATMDKVPAVYVSRGDIDIKSPTMGQATHYNIKDSEDERMIINTMPVIIACVAAAPIAVVENLAEYVKQPLIYFKKEVKLDFRLREFQLQRITSPAITKESKSNFVVEIILNTAFDDGFIIKREGLKLKTVSMELFDSVVKAVGSPCCGN